MRTAAVTWMILLCGCLLTGCNLKIFFGEPNNSRVGEITAPEPVPVTPKLFKQVTAGRFATCGLTIDGDVYCFGDRTNGFLGDGHLNEVFVPTPINTSTMSGSGKFAKVALGLYGGCGISQESILYCWGGGSAPLGTGFTEAQPLPVPIDTTGISGTKTFIDVSTAAFHACGITSENLIYCWGSNSFGGLGNGTTSASLAPVAVNVSALAAADRTFSRVTTGLYFTCGLTLTKKVFCWGQGTSGSLGTGAAANSSLPLAVSTAGIPGDKDFVQLMSGGFHTCAIMEDNAT